MTVYVLATCRRQELWDYTILFIKTIRVGFPTASIVITGNSLTDSKASEMDDYAKSVGASFSNGQPITHQKWIEYLVYTEHEPFWICDTDVVLYESVESWKFDKPLAGYLIPEFHDEFSRCITRSRLHTSLMYIDPLNVIKQLESYHTSTSDSQFTPKANPFAPLVAPLNGRSYFYDTMSMLYHAIGGQPFTDSQKENYFHFHHGTFSDLVLPSVKGGDEIGKLRTKILNNPVLGKGMWRVQDAYFEARQLSEDGVSVIAEIDPADAEEAKKWNIALCCGNESAMKFCDLWYSYVHGIDDIIDTLRDGRPRMSKEQMISLFFKAALLYNSEFFINNRAFLFPIVLQVTNTYQDSVAWEKSPAAHLRAMGDVFRTCGNEMFIMVALLCGGEAHMRRMSMAIKERDYVLQH